MREKEKRERERDREREEPCQGDGGDALHRGREHENEPEGQPSAATIYKYVMYVIMIYNQVLRIKDSHLPAPQRCMDM